MIQVRSDSSVPVETIGVAIVTVLSVKRAAWSLESKRVVMNRRRISGVAASKNVVFTS